LLVPHAQANLAQIPDELADEQVVLLADIASTGISAAESANLQIGDTVAVLAQGPIGLCATAGAKLKGASLIIAVESDAVRTKMSKRMGADIVLDFTKEDVVESVKHLTRGRGVDVAIEAPGTQPTFESALRVLGRVELSPVVGIGLLCFFVPIQLGPPANPADAQYIPRPEWYYLLIFQWLKYWRGSAAIIGVL
jgi:threonine dehydrogenase-like Zn-dependent dehydrogenase